MNNPAPVGDTLVIGYGNELRGDDGIGCRVVRELAALGLPGVRTRVVQQLLPELAAELAAARVFFVDARTAGAPDEVVIDRLGPRPVTAALGHVTDPGGLLSLAQLVYGRAPEGWLVAVVGEDFGLGEHLSARAAANARRALRLLADAIRRGCVQL
jgi:hydrogenase maturation protease